ncbi:MAG: SoxR reducing system RseC family protein [Gallionella sp.]|nr:SoxR reducing system RseC family protein [Gallionella sp.]
MLETRAIVVEQSGGRTFVRASHTGGCSRCQGGECGSAKLSRLFCSKPRQFEVTNAIDARPGEEVLVSIADGALLRSIALVYLLPLGVIIAGALIGSAIWGEAGAILGALIGLVAGFLLARRMAAGSVSRLPSISCRWLPE